MPSTYKPSELERIYIDALREISVTDKTIDSNRNFRRKVMTIVNEASHTAKLLRERLAKTPSPSNTIPCDCQDPLCKHCNGDCVNVATVQLYRKDLDESVFMCQQCADDALTYPQFTTMTEEKADME